MTARHKPDLHEGERPALQRRRWSGAGAGLALAAALALLAVPGPAPAQPQPASPGPGTPGAASLAGLAAWVGCAPHCPAAAGRAGQRLRSSFVLLFPPLRAELERLLGRRPLAELLRLAETGPPVEREGDWVRVALCRQAACATEFMVLFAHLHAGVVVLCWHQERWVPQRLSWSENQGGVWRSGVAGRQRLPPEGCNNRGALGGHGWDLLRRLADE